MSTGLSEYAIHSIESLTSSWFINWVLRGSINDPAMGGSDHHPNWRFFESMEWYLTGRQITHAGDTLNTYCQLILANVIEFDSSAWKMVEERLLRGKKDDRKLVIARLRNCGASDGAVRSSLRDDLGLLWSPESDVILEMRNKLVHQAGFDSTGAVRKAIEALKINGGSMIYPTDLPPGLIPIDFAPDQRLVIDAATGHWATRHIENHIHLMDQNLTYRFGLKKRRWRQRHNGFTLNSETKSLPLPPGTPLPTKGPLVKSKGAFPILPHLSNYDTMADEKEANCARIWRQLLSDTDAFVRSYCMEAEVHIHSLGSGRAGNIRNHTLAGHDLHLDYGLKSSDSDATRCENLGIRIRQESFEPFVTIWSSQSQMTDFKAIELTEKMKDFLRDCIDKALTK